MAMSFFRLAITIWSLSCSIENILKILQSFSLLANALPIGIPAEGLDLGILQPEIGILQRIGILPSSWGIGFPEGYFSAETFHNAYPSAGMPMGRAFVEWLKDLKEK